MTAYFYAALHWVDALMAKHDNFDPGHHDIRREWVKNKWYLRPIKNEYFELKDRSEGARYRLDTYTSTKVKDVIIPLYKKIEEHAQQQLDEPPMIRVRLE